MTNESPYINNSLIGSSDDEIFYLNNIKEWLLNECWVDPEELCAMDIVIEAVKSKSSAEEYRTPKTPMYKMVYGKRLLSEAYCIECGNTVFINDNYCNKCGQAIDWTEVQNGIRRSN